MLRSLVKDTAAYGVNEMIFRFVNFIVFPILAHFLTIEEFGIATLLTTITGFIGVFFSGINNSLQKYYFDPAIPQEDRPALVSTSLWILLGLLPGVLLVSVAIAYPFRETIGQRYHIDWSILLVAMISILPMQLFDLIRGILRVHFAPWSYTLFSNVYNVIFAGLTLLLTIVYEMHVGGMIWGGLIAYLVVCPLGLWLVRKDLKWTLRLDFAKRIWAFGYPFIFTSLAYWIFMWTDRLMLGELSSATELGRYGLAAKFGMILSFVINSFGRAWSPFAFKARLEDPGYRTTYSRALTLWCFVLLILQAVTSFFATEAIMVLMPQSYWSVAQLLPCIAFGLAVSGTTQVTAFGISLEGKSFFLTRGAWIAAMVNVILNSLFIPAYGAMGAVIATAISYLALTSYYMYISQRLHRIPVEWRHIGVITAMSIFTLAASTVCLQLTWSPLLVMLKGALLVLIAYGGHWLKLISYQELFAHLVGLFKRRAVSS